MDNSYYLAFSLVVIFNSIEISSASSPPHEIDFISKLDHGNEHGSHQASSSNSHLNREGIPGTELRLNTNPGTYMHFHLDPQNPSTIPNFEAHFYEQVPSNAQNIPLTMLDFKEKEFYFMSGFQYWVPVEFEQRPDGRWIAKKHAAHEITPGNHEVEVNKYREAVGYAGSIDYCYYITFRGYEVALRWEYGKLGVRYLEDAERKFIKESRASQRRS